MTIYWIQYVLIFLSILFFERGNAQNHPSLKFSHLSLEQGLSQSVVYKTCQTRDGLLWFCTQDGLNQYDGYKFKVYSNDPALLKKTKNSQTPSNSSIFTVIEDRSGMLWLGTWGGGLNRFNPRTKTFDHFLNSPVDQSSISNNTVYSILEDPEGNLWMGTDEGINYLNIKSGIFTHFKNNPADSGSLSNNIVFTLYIDQSGTIWAGTLGGGLNRFNKETHSFTIFKNKPNDPNSLSNNMVRSILQDQEGILWIGTEGGLNAFDAKTNQFTSFTNHPADPQSLSGNQVYSLLEGPGNTLWIGTYGGGLNRMDKKTGKFEFYKKDPTNPFSISSNYILSLTQDHSGILWIGTYGGGVNTYDPYFSKFGVFKNNPLDSKSISSNAIRSLFEDSNGNLWIGTRGGGLNKQDKSTGKFEVFKNEPGNSKSLSSNSVYAITENPEGTLWVGTYGGGLNRMNKSNKTFLVLKNDPADPLSLSCNNIYSLCKDGLDVLWIGTDGGGLNKMELPTGKCKVFKNDPNISNCLSNNNILCVYRDKSGIIWVGTRGGGLNRFDPKTEQFTSFENNPSDPYSLSCNYIYGITEDQTGNLWIATDGGGLDLLVYENTTPEKNNDLYKRQVKFIRFTMHDGLPNNCIYGIIPDDDGNLWLSTNKGICKFTPPVIYSSVKNQPVLKDKVSLNIPKTRNYDVFDGLPNNEFNMNAYFKGVSGTIYFGSIEGFMAFKPGQVKDNPFIPPVILTGFQLFNKEVNINPVDEFSLQKVNKGKLIHKESNFYLPQSINYTKKIILLYDENVFSFEFAALHYLVPEKNQYSYKLEGFDKDWNTGGTRRYATYTNLSPGDYTFRVRGSNCDGIWNSEGIHIELTILPPYWQTWWFRTLVIFLLMVTFYVYILWRERKLKKDKQILESIVKERTLQLQEVNEELNQQNEEISSQRDNLQNFNIELQQKNEEIKSQRDEIEYQRDEIQKQNSEIEQKNKNITSSISYAMRIQQSILPQMPLIRSIFSESFVLFLPKNIVSGDFYWLLKIENKTFFAVVDCTGHGVPGAFMSVLSYAILKQTVHEFPVLNPAGILGLLSLEINSTLRKTDKEVNVKDGMDIALCVLNHDTLVLEYAGVHNPMFVIRNNELIKLKPDFHPIGEPFTEDFSSFTNNCMQLQPFDLLYLFTDGFSDQFGGPRNRKFSSHQFEELLISLSSKPMEEQCKLLTKTLEQWMNQCGRKIDQTDDVTIFGIKICS